MRVSELAEVNFWRETRQDKTRKEVFSGPLPAAHQLNRSSRLNSAPRLILSGWLTPLYQVQVTTSSDFLQAESAVKHSCPWNGETESSDATQVASKIYFHRPRFSVEKASARPSCDGERLNEKP